MTKRRDALKDYLSPIVTTEFSAENQIQKPRPKVASGALLSMNEALSGITAEAEELRKALESGSTIVELDPASIDSSFIRDRLDDYEGEAFDGLVASIAEHGQAIPVLVRPHPSQPGKYQLAFGHRRVAALRSLNRPVKAIVRPMTDEELVIAQGTENLERKDLSFIERAMFAFRLEERGMPRSVIMAAFGTSSKGVLSEMISLARRLPDSLVQAIGPAPKVGRPRWLALADLVDNSGDERWRTAIENPRFRSLSSDERFEAVHRTLSLKPRSAEAAKTWMPQDRTVSVRRTVSDKAITMSFSAQDGKRFGEWISTNLESLYETFRKEIDRNGD